MSKQAYAVQKQSTFKKLTAKALSLIHPRMKLEREPITVDTFFRMQEPYDGKKAELNIHPDLKIGKKGMTKAKRFIHSVLALALLSNEIQVDDSVSDDALRYMRLPEQVAKAKKELRAELQQKIYSYAANAYSCLCSYILIAQAYFLAKTGSFVYGGKLFPPLDFVAKQPKAALTLVVGGVLEYFAAKFIIKRVKNREENSLKMAANMMIVEKYNQYRKKASEVELVKSTLDLKALIAKTESCMVERKSSLFCGPDGKDSAETRKTLGLAKAKVISAFLNTNGGLLFIGVEDNGRIVGIEDDYAALPGKGGQDAFNLKLSQIIDNYLGRAFHQYIIPFIEKIDGKDVAIVYIRPSGMPAYVKDNGKAALYVKTPHGASPLAQGEVGAYIESRWPFS